MDDATPTFRQTFDCGPASSGPPCYASTERVNGWIANSPPPRYLLLEWRGSDWDKYETFGYTDGDQKSTLVIYQCVVDCGLMTPCVTPGTQG